MRLNLLHQLVLALGFDGRATCAVDLHQCPLPVVDATMLRLSHVRLREVPHVRQSCPLLPKAADAVVAQATKGRLRVLEVALAS